MSETKWVVKYRTEDDRVQTAFFSDEEETPLDCVNAMLYQDIPFKYILGVIDKENDEAVFDALSAFDEWLEEQQKKDWGMVIVGEGVDENEEIRERVEETDG